jgi:hypothetical protein
MICAPLQGSRSDVSLKPLLKNRTTCLSIAFALLLVCLVLASGLAIRDGSAARSLIETLAVVALASLGISTRATDINFVGRSTEGLKVAAAIPAIWMVVQLLPTPIGAHSIWAYAHEALAQQARGHISIDLGETILTLAFYLANISLTLVTIFVARDRRRAEQILFALAAIATITALGLLTGKWTLIASAIDNSVLASVSALGILLSIASGERTIERHKTGGEKPETEAQNVRTALIASSIGLMVGIVGLSASATLNVGLTTIFGVATFASVRTIRRAGVANWAALLLIATMLVAAAMIVFWRYDPTRALSPFLQFATASSPGAIAVTQRMLSDTSWLGAGAGTFSALLPLYQDLGSSVTQPPSTISALAIELGWPMALFAIVTAIWLVAILYRGALARGRDSFYPAAAAAGAVTMLAEAFCDSSLLNSCVAVMIGALMGLGLAQTISSRESP